MKKSDSLDILMNGTSVGVWRRLSGNVHECTYEESWLTRPECRPVSLSVNRSQNVYLREYALVPSGWRCYNR